MTKLESEIQREISKRYRKAGWICFKVPADGINVPAGFPDLMCLGPGAKVVFIEVKTETGTPSPVQEAWAAVLRNLGHRYILTNGMANALLPLEEEHDV